MDYKNDLMMAGLPQCHMRFCLSPSTPMSYEV